MDMYYVYVCVCMLEVIVRSLKSFLAVAEAFEGKFGQFEDFPNFQVTSRPRVRSTKYDPRVCFVAPHCRAYCITSSSAVEGMKKRCANCLRELSRSRRLFMIGKVTEYLLKQIPPWTRARTSFFFKLVSPLKYDGIIVEIRVALMEMTLTRIWEG